MKNLFVSLSVIGFFVFALSQSSPATLLVNDNEIVVCADDTTKCVKHSGDLKKCKDVCNHKNMNQSCDPNNCKDKSQMKKCPHENMNKKDPKKK